MKCPKCHVENPEGKKFCRKCGTALPLACSHCGAVVSADDEFCGECGQSLAAPKTTPPLDYSHPNSYTPKFLAEKILTTRSSVEGERKLVTVLFADVANFTTISEKLDPEEIHEIMDACFKILMDEIHRYEGTINQFTGDGVMALFGAPLAHEDHAQRACHAALAIQNSLDRYSQKLKEDLSIDFKMRLGLNSGPVVVGAIGDDLRMDYTAIGDTINLASRMQSSAAPGTVLVSSHTHRLAKDFFAFSSLGPIPVKGKEEPQDAYVLLSPTEVKTRIGASAVAGLTPFVGRVKEMETLKEALDKARSGSGQVVGIVGEAGVGKSRILLEMKRLFTDMALLEGHCLHYGGSMAYLPVLDILRSYFGIKEGEQEFPVKRKMREKVSLLDENLKTLLAPLYDLLSLKVDDETYLKLEPKDKREKIFEALRDLLVRESQVRPVVLIVEDLHWIDTTSEEFLDYLIGWLANTNMLLILLYRPEYTHRWGNKSYYTTIRVDQLSLPTSAELVQSILSEADMAPELRDLILTKAAGNPLFMEELTHTLLENGTIENKGGRYLLNKKPSDIQIPDTIQGIIAARMDRLEENLKRIMQVASVIGREFAFSLLQSITEMKEELKAQLLNLQGLEFIYEKSLFPELEYVFKHALTQEVAYNSLLVKRRQDLHKKIGHAIEEIYADRTEEFYEMLAYHYSRGEDLERACRYLTLSGNKALRLHSPREAHGYYQDALATLRRLPETEERKKEQLDVLVLAATPMLLLGYPEGSLGMLQEGEALAKGLRDNPRLGFFYGRLTAYHSLFRGNHLLGIKYSEDALQEARKSEDIDLIVPIAYGLVPPYLAAAQFEKFVATAREVLDLLEKEERTSDYFGLFANPYAVLSGFCGLSLGQLGNFQEGKSYVEKGLRHAARMGDLRTLSTVESAGGIFFHIKGDWTAAAEHLRKSITYSEEVKFLTFLYQGCCYLGNTCAYLGDPQTGKSYGKKGLALQRETGIEAHLSLQYLYLGDTHLQLGDLENARSLVEEALRLSRKNGENFSEAVALIFLGRILGRTETPQIHKAEECLLQGVKIADELKAKPAYAQGHLFLGELYTHGGQKEKALENLRKAETLFQEMGMDYWLDETRKVSAGL
jgi:class 3 adenylate cyclase/tetratricopeptide (TPR) repeat protein